MVGMLFITHPVDVMKYPIRNKNKRGKNYLGAKSEPIIPWWEGMKAIDSMVLGTCTRSLLNGAN